MRDDVGYSHSNGGVSRMFFVLTSSLPVAYPAPLGDW